MGLRDDSDEAYGVDLYNRILGENASAQHGFRLAAGRSRNERRSRQSCPAL